jgi:hypothetical protein
VSVDQYQGQYQGVSAMDSGAIELARETAKHLGPHYPHLLGEVDETINPMGADETRSGLQQKPETFEPITIAVGISLAALLLNIAKFVYDIQKDQRAAEAKRRSRDELRGLINAYLDQKGADKSGDRAVVIEGVLDQVT